MPSRQELVAHNRDDDLIAKEIGADVIIYQVNYLCIAFEISFICSFTILLTSSYQNKGIR